MRRLGTVLVVLLEMPQLPHPQTALVVAAAGQRPPAMAAVIVYVQVKNDECVKQQHRLRPPQYPSSSTLAHLS
jgi:hypothetical protein